MCFQIPPLVSSDLEKRLMLTKIIDYVLSIDTFEQKCVVVKDMLQSPRLKDNVKTIGVDQ